jgi:hypothetical protein
MTGIWPDNEFLNCHGPQSSLPRSHTHWSLQPWNPVHAPPSYFFKINFNIILPSISRHTQCLHLQNTQYNETSWECFHSRRLKRVSGNVWMQILLYIMNLCIQAEHTFYIHWILITCTICILWGHMQVSYTSLAAASRWRWLSYGRNM